MKKKIEIQQGDQITLRKEPCRTTQRLLTPGKPNVLSSTVQRGRRAPSPKRWILLVFSMFVAGCQAGWLSRQKNRMRKWGKHFGDVLTSDRKCCGYDAAGKPCSGFLKPAKTLFSSSKEQLYQGFHHCDKCGVKLCNTKTRHKRGDGYMCGRVAYKIKQEFIDCYKKEGKCIEENDELRPSSKNVSDLYGEYGAWPSWPDGLVKDLCTIVCRRGKKDADRWVVAKAHLQLVEICGSKSLIQRRYPLPYTSGSDPSSRPVRKCTCCGSDRGNGRFASYDKGMCVRYRRTHEARLEANGKTCYCADFWKWREQIPFY